jgi:hypothetical protein
MSENNYSVESGKYKKVTVSSGRTSCIVTTLIHTSQVFSNRITLINGGIFPDDKPLSLVIDDSSLEFLHEALVKFYGEQIKMEGGE